MTVRRTVGSWAAPILLALIALVPPLKSTAGEFGGLDVPFVPTPPDVVSAMLRMADVKPGDIVYDLGSGDGRIVVEAIKAFGVKKAVGVDLDPARVADGIANAKANNVSDRASFFQGDVFTFDFSEATVVTMYLLPTVNIKLRPRVLSELKPGTRVVSHQFTMGDWTPDAEQTVGYGNQILSWVVPAKVEGTWEWQIGPTRYRLQLEQKYQKAAGPLTVGEQAATVATAFLKGPSFRLEATVGGRPTTFEGTVSGDVISGISGGQKFEAKRIR